MNGGYTGCHHQVYLSNHHQPTATWIVNTIQTNGLLIDDEWTAFFREHHFLVGISLDGPRKMNDAARFDPVGNGTFERIMKSIDSLKRYQIDFNILTVVTEQTADVLKTWVEENLR